MTDYITVRPGLVTGNLIAEYPIPLNAHWVLTRIKKEVPRAFIAGGCIRDTILKRPVSDIDVFVPHGEEYLAREAIAHSHPKHTKEVPEPYFIMHTDVRTVNYYEGEDALPVNIIGITQGLDNPKAQLERFDFGLCRVAWDGKRLWKDLSFDVDSRDETFTLLFTQSDDAHENSMRRYARISQKYPGWKLVDKTKEEELFPL